MHTGSATHLLSSLAVVLCVAALTTILFQRLRQPVVLGYLIAGLVVGPHVPVPLVADEGVVRTLAELGVILLLFALGLEFSMRKLLRVGPSAALAACIEVTVMFWLGMVVGRAFGWSPVECLFCGALVAISSTTIVAKVLEGQRVSRELRELVFSILIVEDLAGILLIALLTTVAGAAGAPAGGMGDALASTAARLALFLAVVVGGGMLVVPRLMRTVLRLRRPETTLVAALAVCFAISLLAGRFGYSVALGAFLAGSLVAESGEAAAVAHVVEPVRDLFVALFFIAVGMSIEPGAIVQHAGPIAALAAVVVGGKVLGVSLGAFLAGRGVRLSLQAGLSLAQIGEFSFIIAALGRESGATGAFLYPVAVAVSGFTTLLTPWLIRAAGPVADTVYAHLPHPLQTVAALYGSWVEALRERPLADGLWARVRRPALRQLLDAVLLGAVVIGAARAAGPFALLVSSRYQVAPATATMLVMVGAVLVGAPLAFGLVARAGRLGELMALHALPPSPPGGAPPATSPAGTGDATSLAPPSVGVDLARAPRGAFVVALQLACLLVVGLPLVALTQPFLGGFQGAALLALALLALGVPFWRSAANLEGHVRAGAEILLEAMASQSRGDEGHGAAHGHDGAAGGHALPAFPGFPGLGTPAAVEVPAASAAVGQTLSQLHLRGQTGATVLAIRRAGDPARSVVSPTGHEILDAGDVLAVAGTHDAIAAARDLLTRPGSPSSPSS